jgi:carbamoyl-phosphate synthase small subunit
VETKKQKIGQLKPDRKSSERSSFFIKKRPAYLTLSDGASFKGFYVGSGPETVGEVVFNTGMTGYVESLTDPSYRGQILVFTYPMIGNYGVQLDDTESQKIQVSGVIVNQAAERYSHSRADHGLLKWLNSQGVPLLTGVDTRELTKYLRTRGTMLGKISSKKSANDLKLDFKPESSIRAKVYNPRHKTKVILVDCGAKGNILKNLTKMPLQVKLVPHDYDYTNEAYDGVLLSNGPGDPVDYQKTIKIAAKNLKKNKPMFGICLGSQIMALAAGARTYKLHFGHRGHNQPCLHSSSGRCYITSQNHGYAIDEKSLPQDWQVTFRNLNDDSVEGIEHKSKPFFSVQFHPEACPGPTDTGWLFERFFQTVSP